MLALCNKTLLAQQLLDDIIANTPELTSSTIQNKALLHVLLYDTVFGQGVRVWDALLR